MQGIFYAFSCKALFRFPFVPVCAFATCNILGTEVNTWISTLQQRLWPRAGKTNSPGWTVVFGKPPPLLESYVTPALRSQEPAVKSLKLISWTDEAEGAMLHAMHYKTSLKQTTIRTIASPSVYIDANSVWDPGPTCTNGPSKVPRGIAANPAICRAP